MALNLSALRKPLNRQVIDPSTGLMREEWELYFNELTGQLNSATGELGTDKAPADAQYIVGAANAALTAERVATNSTSNTFNLSTPGQAAVERAALTGDVTASANSNATTIASAAVTNAKLANMAQQTIKARKTLSTGAPEDCTLSEVLDFIGSAAQGDILYRGSSAWARLAAGTENYFLQTKGAGQNPQYAGSMALLASGTVSAAATLDLVLTSYIGFRSLIINLQDIIPATDDTQLFMRTSTNGGSSYDAGASDYCYANFTFSSSETQLTDGSNGAAQIGISTNDANAKLTSDAGERANYAIHLPNRTGTGKCQVQWSGGNLGTTGTPACFSTIGTGFRDTAADVDAVRFLMSSGNIASLNYAIYGWS
jgi:hypothetical protein